MYLLLFVNLSPAIFIIAVLLSVCHRVIAPVSLHSPSTIFSFYACALRSSVLPNLRTCSSLGPIYFIPFVSFCFSLFSSLFLLRILSPISAASSDFLSTDMFLSFPDRDDEVSTASLQPLDPDGGGAAAAAVGTSLGYAVMM